MSYYSLFALFLCEFIIRQKVIWRYSFKYSEIDHPTLISLSIILFRDSSMSGESRVILSSGSCIDFLGDNSNKGLN